MATSCAILTCFLCASVVMFCVFPVSVIPAKILAVPGVTWSHFNVLKHITKELADRGHQVILISYWKQELKHVNENKNLSIHTCAGLDQIDQYDDIAKHYFENKLGLLKMVEMVIHRAKEICKCILKDSSLMRELKTCDLMISDIFITCGTVLKDLLKIPRVTLYATATSSTFEAWYHGIPVPLSYIPVVRTGLTNQMTFLQRTRNVCEFSISPLFWYFVSHRPANAIRRTFNITPERTFSNSEGDSELVLVQTDTVINYARPLPPGVILVGPITPRPPHPLPRDLEEFMSMRTSAGEVGVIFVSLGAESDISYLGEEFTNKLMKTFGKLKEKVLCKMKVYPKKSVVPSNVKILQWIPQNDVLGHVNTRLFMSHVGHNSMSEGAYHGVPIVATPLLWEQHENARMMENAGIGIGVDIQAITADHLYRVIQRVLNERSFRENATRVSRILKDRRRTPVQESADHVEWLLRHGSAHHLRPAGLDLPYYQYFLIDVIAFIVAVVMVTIAIVCYLCRCLCAVCKKTRPSSKNKVS